MNMLYVSGILRDNLIQQKEYIMYMTRRTFLSGLSSVAVMVLVGGETIEAEESRPAKGAPGEADFTLHIAETTDVHGNFFPYNFATGSTKKTNSLAHVYSYIEQERARVAASNGKEYFMLVDNGDNLQGEPILNIYNDGLKNGTVDKHIVPQIYNFMGTEVGVVGNHDVEFGKKVYDHLNAHFAFPLLAANAVKQGTQSAQDKVKPGNGKRIPYFAKEGSNGAYVIKRFKVEGKPDIKVAILGLSTPESKVFLENGDNNEDIYFEDMIESAAYWMPKIQAEKPDLVVGLFHAGFDYKLAPGQDENTYRNYNPVQLVADRVKGFDVIFWGHDHRIKEEVSRSDVLLLGGNHYAQELNIADIAFTYDPEQKKYRKRLNGKYLQVLDSKRQKKVAGTLVDTIGNKGEAKPFALAASPAFMAKFQPTLDKAVKIFRETKIGTLKTPLNTKDAVFGDSAFNDLVHHLEKYAAKKEFGVDVDMTIAAPLKFSFPNDTYELKGDLVYADMWNLYFYDNLHAVIEMTGKEIKDYMEYTFGEWFNEMSGEDDDLLRLKSAENKEHPEYKKTNMIYWNMDTFAGIVYELDVSKKSGDRVRILGVDKDFDGKVDGDFDPNKKYKVSVNSYRYGGGGGHFKAIGIERKDMKARTLNYSATGLRDYLISYIQDEHKGVIAPEPIGHWKVVPEAWAASGRRKDEPLIFWPGATGR